MPTMSWGLTDEEIKERWPNATFFGKSMNLEGLTVNNFPGDCGSLIITGANQASLQGLRAVEEYASASGFSKLFATIVAEKKYADLRLAIMKEAGWRLVSRGNSNRNSHKRDYVMFKRINCSYKGY